MIIILSAFASAVFFDKESSCEKGLDNLLLKKKDSSTQAASLHMIHRYELVHMIS